MVPCLPTHSHGGYLAKLGIGKDIWNFPPENLDDFLFFVYIETLVYVVAIGVVKIAILVSPITHEDASNHINSHSRHSIYGCSPAKRFGAWLTV